MALSPKNSVYFFHGCVCLPVVDHMAAAPIEIVTEGAVNASVLLLK